MVSSIFCVGLKLLPGKSYQVCVLYYSSVRLWFFFSILFNSSNYCSVIKRHEKHLNFLFVYRFFNQNVSIWIFVSFKLDRQKVESFCFQNSTRTHNRSLHLITVIFFRVLTNVSNKVSFVYVLRFLTCIYKRKFGRLTFKISHTISCTFVRITLVNNGDGGKYGKHVQPTNSIKILSKIIDGSGSMPVTLQIDDGSTENP